MKRILIIEDNESIAELERDYLQASGFETKPCFNGREGIQEALSGTYGSMILDLMLPGESGFEICREVRERFSTPILIVSAKRGDIDKVRGLGLDADGCITRPFSPRESVARVRAHLSRYERLISAKRGDVLIIRGLKIDRDAHRVFVNGEERTFTAKEFDLLNFLASNPNCVFKRDELFREIWGEESIGEIATITVHIKEVREKIEVDSAKSQYIGTIWGVGYRFRIWQGGREAIAAETMILVVDGEKEIADLVEIYLIGDGYQVVKANDAGERLQLLDEYEVQLVLLGIMIPDMDGLEMCTKIRGTKNIPIIMPSAKGADIDRIKGFGTGADDYVTKPFNPLELAARTKSQLCRYTQFSPRSSEEEVSPKKKGEISVRGLVINRDNHKVSVGGKEVRLTPIEFDILYPLASNTGRVFSTDGIFQNVWSGRVYGAANTAMVHTRRLRDRLKEDSREDEVITAV